MCETGVQMQMHQTPIPRDRKSRERVANGKSDYLLPFFFFFLVFFAAFAGAAALAVAAYGIHASRTKLWELMFSL
jgi:hypothetical protein